MNNTYMLLWSLVNRALINRSLKSISFEDRTLYNTQSTCNCCWCPGVRRHPTSAAMVLTYLARVIPSSALERLSTRSVIHQQNTRDDPVYRRLKKYYRCNVWFIYLAQNNLVLTSKYAYTQTKNTHACVRMCGSNLTQIQWFSVCNWSWPNLTG